MITLQDHIEELRAELRGCLSRRERDHRGRADSRHRGTQGTGPRRRGRSAAWMRGRRCASFSMPDRLAGARPRIASTSAAPAAGATPFVFGRDGSPDEQICEIPHMECAAAGTHGGPARTERQGSRLRPSASTPTCSSNSQPIRIARGCGAMRHPLTFVTCRLQVSGRWR